MRDYFLHLGRILRRRQDADLIELAGPGDRRLRFEIEVVLPAIAPGAFEDVLRCGESSADISAPDMPRRSDELLLALRVVDGEDRLELLDVDLDRRFRRA